MADLPVPRRGVDVEAVATTSSYRELIDRLQRRIRESQARAARALNTELVMLYWSIGRDILAQQKAGGWGDDIVSRIADDLRVATGSAHGFSRRHLFYTRRFAALWPDAEKVQTVSAQIGGRITRCCSTRGPSSLSCTTALSAASLRVEMQTAKHQAREAHQEIRSLKARLARTLGQEIADKHPEHSVSAAAVKDLHAQVEQLLATQDDLRRQLRDTEEELEAARRLNRTLIRERNATASEASA